MQATEDFIQGARQARSDKLAEIPAVEAELKYFHELMEELERKEKDDGKECLVSMPRSLLPETFSCFKSLIWVRSRGLFARARGYTTCGAALSLRRR